ncbi:MAG TPA: phage portal protein [Phycisphaerae bacterium]|nr:phage portal protein [Phycisphaerae bacterium]
MGWFGSRKRQRSAAAAAFASAYAAGARAVRAKYDAAQTTPENRRHWANADALSANAAMTPDVRRILRMRARYEVANNSYAKGIVLTLANDVIGTGPRLQMLSEDPKANRLIEREFAAWMKTIDLAAKLRTMRMARAEDGEAFAMLVSNPNLKSDVQLDIRLIEAEQVTTPVVASMPTAAVDGIVFDDHGNPITYHVLKSHPGASIAPPGTEYDLVPAKNMVHWFRADRPGQSRGVPDITPALPLFAQLRRYTLAVIAAAETAADIAVFMKTSMPADGEATPIAVNTEMEFSPRMAVFAPEGWEPSQIKAEQPPTTYEMFKREIVNEIARCLNMPYNIAAGNSARYNYASGRLDHQMYFKSIRVEQTHCEGVVLDPILNAWMVEAVKVLDDLQDLEEWPHQWFWTGHEHVDPNKEATAATALLGAGLLTEAEYCARKGMDWEEEQDQRKREAEGRKKRGLPEPTGAAPAKDPDEDLDEKIDEKLDEKRETADAPA